MSLYLYCKVGFVSIPGGILLWCFLMLQYVTFPAVLGQLSGDSSYTTARKTLDTLYDC